MGTVLLIGEPYHLYHIVVVFHVLHMHLHSMLLNNSYILAHNHCVLAWEVFSASLTSSPLFYYNHFESLSNTSIHNIKYNKSKHLPKLYELDTVAKICVCYRLARPS